MQRLNFKLTVALLATLLLSTYWNHFHNSFHFDDSHSVLDNAYIRTITNIPRFFIDGRTFSVLPTNQSYRPIVSTTLAIDYWLAGGLEPFFFHLSTFIWFVAQLWLMYLLFKTILSKSSAGEHRFGALFAVAVYALHPVNAETINYVIQRGEVLSTLGLVAGLVGYGNIKLRRSGAYLLPVVIGALAKPPAVMFAPILFLYILLFEERVGLTFWQRSYSWKGIVRSFRQSVPAIVVCILVYGLQDSLTPKTFTPGGSSLAKYLITQPFVHLHYFLSFFSPTDLSVDSDWQLFSSVTDARVLIGFLFVVVMLAVACWTSEDSRTRPISFGVFWFFIALGPTTVVPLAEVTNDHRMYFPFVGLALALSCLGGLIAQNYRLKGIGRQICGLGAVSILLTFAWGTHQRNLVWKTEESLWLDATIKSPGNGRALMNYGLTLMAKGDYYNALAMFERALPLTPNYSSLESNLGIVNAALRRDFQAEVHFKRAVLLTPNLSSPYYFYARWLNSIGRSAEAIINLRVALDKVESDFEARYLLMQIYLDQNNLSAFNELAAKTLDLAPDDLRTLSYLAKAAKKNEHLIDQIETSLKEAPSLEKFLDLSLLYFQQGQFEDSIEAGQAALKIDPKSAKAYNNIGAAYAELGEWPQAIAAQEHALKIDPNFELAKNNLAWAKSERAKRVVGDAR